MNSKEVITFATGCSGIGAPEVAFESLGWKALWNCEIEPFPSAVLRYHWPDVPNAGDFMTLEEKIRRKELEAPDVFVAGTPCQAFSVAGLRKSFGDKRGGLTLEYIRIADAVDDVRLGDGKPKEACPDGPQYKAYGNSMCVNVIRWIGKQIEKELEV